MGVKCSHLTFEQLIANTQQAGLDVELLEVPPMAKNWVARVWHLGTIGSEAGFPELNTACTSISFAWDMGEVLLCGPMRPLQSGG